jgi:hypothetical protein
LTYFYSVALLSDASLTLCIKELLFIYVVILAYIHQIIKYFHKVFQFLCYFFAYFLYFLDC